MNAYCVPFALSFVTGRTPDEIADLIRTERGDGGRVTRVAPRHYKPVLLALGYKILATVSRPGMTIRKWASVREKWDDKSTWLVRMSGHIMVYRDGLFYDNLQPTGVAAGNFQWSNSRVKEAWQIGAVS